MPDLRKRLTEMGAVVNPLTSKDFTYIQAEMRKWLVLRRTTSRFSSRCPLVPHRRTRPHVHDLTLARFPLGVERLDSRAAAR